MSNIDKTITVQTFADLKGVLDTLTPEQLAQPVVWSGDERGGKVKHAYIHGEDWIGEIGDHETWIPRSDAEGNEDYDDASVCIPAGTVHLMVD